MKRKVVLHWKCRTVLIWLTYNALQKSFIFFFFRFVLLMFHLSSNIYRHRTFNCEFFDLHMHYCHDNPCCSLHRIKLSDSVPCSVFFCVKNLKFRCHLMYVVMFSVMLLPFIWCYTGNHVRASKISCSFISSLWRTIKEILFCRSFRFFILFHLFSSESKEIQLMNFMIQTDRWGDR